MDGFMWVVCWAMGMTVLAIVLAIKRSEWEEDYRRLEKAYDDLSGKYLDLRERKKQCFDQAEDYRKRLAGVLLAANGEAENKDVVQQD